MSNGENNEQNDILNVEEAADYLRISTKKLREWTKPGKVEPKSVLRAIRLEKIPSRLLFSRKDIDEWVEEHTINKGRYLDFNEQDKEKDT